MQYSWDSERGESPIGRPCRPCGLEPWRAAAAQAASPCACFKRVHFNQFLFKACSLRCRLYFLPAAFTHWLRSGSYSFVYRITRETVYRAVTGARLQNLLHRNSQCIKNAQHRSRTQSICKKALSSFRKNKALSPYELGWKQRTQSPCLHGRTIAAACCAMARTPHCRAVTSSIWRTRSCAMLQRWCRGFVKYGL